MEEEWRSKDDVIQKAHQDAVQEWEAERDIAKQERRKLSWNKPKHPKLEPTIPRPKKPMEDEPEDDEEGDGDDSDDDMEGWLIAYRPWCDASQRLV